MGILTPTSRSSQQAGPAWDIATLFPNQGQWAEGDYLSLTDNTNHLVEFSDGRVEVLPMPTMSHQMLIAYLYNALLAYAGPRQLGRVLFAALRVRIREGTYREPDLVFMLAEHAQRMGERFWEGADLVMEVVSEDNREHDLVTKRREYAEAGIPEYWIIDPRDKRVSVLQLLQGEYRETAFTAGQAAASVLLSGFSIDVTTLFAAATV